MNAILVSILVHFLPKTCFAVNKEDFKPLLLQDQLFTNYSKYVKPRLNPLETVNVDLMFTYGSVISLDNLKQELASLLFLDIFWTDELLTWNLTEYPAITTIYTGVEKIWVPDISLTNEMENARVLYDAESLIPVTSDGLVKWSLTVSTKTRCDLDMTAFPFDYQNCEIRLLTNQPLTEVVLKESRTGLSPNQSGNGEFRVVSILGTVETVTYNGEALNSYIGSLTLQRRSSFYVINIIMPVLLLSVLSKMAFLVSAESGDKISLVLTVFLSQAVFMSYVSSFMPTTSDEIPLLTLYLAALLVLDTLSVVSCLFVLHVYHRDLARVQPCAFFRVVLASFGPRVLKNTSASRKVHASLQRLHTWSKPEGDGVRRTSEMSEKEYAEAGTGLEPFQNCGNLNLDTDDQRSGKISQANKEKKTDHQPMAKNLKCPTGGQGTHCEQTAENLKCNEGTPTQEIITQPVIVCHTEQTSQDLIQNETLNNKTCNKAGPDSKPGSGACNQHEDRSAEVALITTFNMARTNAGLVWILTSKALDRMFFLMFTSSLLLFSCVFFAMTGGFH